MTKGLTMGLTCPVFVTKGGWGRTCQAGGHRERVQWENAVERAASGRARLIGESEQLEGGVNAGSARHWRTRSEGELRGMASQSTEVIPDVCKHQHRITDQIRHSAAERVRQETMVKCEIMHATERMR
jgi:hypothetical protein